MIKVNFETNFLEFLRKKKYFISYKPLCNSLFSFDENSYLQYDTVYIQGSIMISSKSDAKNQQQDERIKMLVQSLVSKLQ